MGFSVLKCFEYITECDICGTMYVVHTGDQPIVVYVHDNQSAIKGFQYHRIKKGFICDDCYKKIKGRK